MHIPPCAAFAVIVHNKSRAFINTKSELQLMTSKTIQDSITFIPESLDMRASAGRFRDDHVMGYKPASFIIS